MQRADYFYFLPLESNLIIEALRKRGAKWEILPDTNIVMFTHKRKRFHFTQSFTPATPYIYNNNLCTKILEDSGFPFSRKTTYKKTYQILITENGYFNVLEKHSPLIIGDGISSIEDLMIKENFKRVNINSRFIQPLLLDMKKLREKKMLLSSILKKNETLCLFINNETGVTFKEVTSLVHNSFLVYAKRIHFLFPHVGYIRFQITTDTYEHVLKKGNYMITDVAITPGENVEYNVWNGIKKRKAVDVICDLLEENASRTFDLE